jgi:sulfatase modifying factor 1
VAASARAVVLVAALTLGCQRLAGFSGFETDQTGAQGSEGMACHDDGVCSGNVCLLGYCRVPCSSDAGCPRGSICLGDQARGGCRLRGELETRCQGSCKNANLVCGLDGSCRIGCNASLSCPLQGQDCIGNACVGHGETDWEAVWGQCMNPRGETTCGADGKTLTTCNVTRPGKAVVATCDSAELCQQGMQAGGTGCGPQSCMAGHYSCDGAVLRRCSAAATGFDEMTTCASPALCVKGLQASPPACAPPMCGAGASAPAAAKCMDGQLLTCSADQQGFDATDCAGKQCDPGGKQCFSLAIDAHEVTRASYAQFLASSPAAGNQPTGCMWNTSFTPDAACLQLADACNPATSSCDAVPQVCVDWCDAQAYCRWAGGHLCGSLSGGDAMVALSQSDDPGQSAWMNACSAGGQYTWPEGNVWRSNLEGQACNGMAKERYGNGGAYPAGTLIGCHSPVPSYAAIFDLSGNVAEWENSCSMEVKGPNASRDDTCRVRGGSFASGEPLLRCDAHPQDLARNAVRVDVGFRCCGR